MRGNILKICNEIADVSRQIANPCSEHDFLILSEKLRSLKHDFVETLYDVKVGQLIIDTHPHHENMIVCKVIGIDIESILCHPFKIAHFALRVNRLKRNGKFGNKVYSVNQEWYKPYNKYHEEQRS